MPQRVSFVLRVDRERKCPDPHVRARRCRWMQKLYWNNDASPSTWSTSRRTTGRTATYVPTLVMRGWRATNPSSGLADDPRGDASYRESRFKDGLATAS